MRDSPVILSLLVFCVIVLASCGQATGPANNALEGRWKCIEIDGEAAGPGAADYIFAGKKLTIKQEGFEKRADIVKMTAKAFTFRYEGGQAQVVFDYTCDGKRLSVKPRAEGGQPLTFERQ